MPEEFSWSVSEPSAPRPDALAGRVVGEQFLLQELLGSGGMGRVYRGRDLRSGRGVAVKLLHGIPTSKQLERFRREGELSARLDHPGIVRVHAGGTWEGLPFLVYELIESGQELGLALRGADRPRAIQLVLEAARALEHAHGHGVVHRDVKPQNVLVDAQGRARVTDFGVAAATWLPRLTQTGGLVGTPAYMAPEQFRSSSEVGPASDVWALGVILYKALTGVHPFPAGTLLEQEAQVHRGRLRHPRELSPDLSPALDAVCVRALARSPADRYPHAGALADALEVALRDGGAPGHGRLLRWLGLAAAAVVLLALFLLRERSPAGAPSGPTRQVAALASPTASDLPLDAALLLDLARGEPLAALVPRAGPTLEAAIGPLGTVPVPAAAEAALTEGPPVLRQAAAAWLLVQVERDLAFLERGPLAAAQGLALEARRDRASGRVELVLRLSGGTDADRAAARLYPVGSPARAACLGRLLASLPADAWGACLAAEEALARGEAAAALAALDRAVPGQRAPVRRALLARVRALLALDRAAEALAALGAADDPRDPERVALRAEALERTGRSAEAASARERLALLRGARRAEAHQIVVAGVRATRAAQEDPEALGAELGRAAELDPGSPFAYYYASQARYALGNREEPLANLVQAVLEAPWLLHELQSALMTLFHARKTVSLPLEPLLDGCVGEGPAERLARGFVLCALVELDGRADRAGEALALLDRLLEEDPSLHPAWTLRGFLQLRAGRLEHAARDLEVAREVDSSCPSLLLYQALLLGARRAPREEVVEALLRAHEGGYQLWSRRRELAGWRIDAYPEIARYDELTREIQDRAQRLRVRNLPASW